MTEDLWSHALKFLDKYRTNEDNYDIEELYKFADQTGILERHKQMLAQPFHENQVDMKIMYYELIKMLIDYERNKEPEIWDASKSVCKIEGYQELTNKLQRYLNQKFMLDGDQLKDHKESLKEVDEKAETAAQRCDRLEASLIQLSNSYTMLKENFSQIEHKNQEMLGSSKNIEKDEVDTRHGDLAARLEALEQQQATAASDSKKLMQENEVLRQQQQENMRLWEESTSNVEVVRENIQHIKSKLKDVDLVKNKLLDIDKIKVKEKTDEVEKIMNRVESLEQKANDHSKFKSRLSQLEAANNKLAGLEDVRNKVIRDNLTEVEGVKTQLSQLTAASAGMDILAGAVEDLESKIGQLMPANTTKDHHEILTKVNVMKEQLLGLERRTDTADDLELMRKRVSSMEGRLANAELITHKFGELKLISNRVDDVDDSIAKIVSEQETLMEKFTEAASGNKNVECRIAKLSGKIEEDKEEMLHKLQCNEHKTAEGHETLDGLLGNLEKRVNDNASNISKNTALVEQNTQDVNKLQSLHLSVTKQLDGLDKSHKMCWGSVEEAQHGFKEASDKMAELVDINKTELSTIGFNVANLQDSFNDISPAVQKNTKDSADLTRRMLMIEGAGQERLELISTCQIKIDETNKKLNTDVGSVRVQLSQLWNQMQDIPKEDLKEQLVKVNVELLENSKYASENEKKTVDQEKKIKSMEEELTLQKQKLETMNDLHSKVNFMEDVYQHKELENKQVFENITNEIKTLTTITKNIQTDACNDSLNQMKVTLGDFSTRLVVVQQQLDCSIKERDQMKNVQQTLVETAEKVSSLAKTTDTELTSTSFDVAELKNSLGALRADHNTANENIEKRIINIDDSISQITNQSVKHQQLSQQVSYLGEVCEGAKQDVKEIRQSLLGKSENWDSVRNEVKSQCDRLAAVEEGMLEAQERSVNKHSLESVMQEIESLKSSHKNTQDLNELITKLEVSLRVISQTTQENTQQIQHLHEAKQISDEGNKAIMVELKKTVSAFMTGEMKELEKKISNQFNKAEEEVDKQCKMIEASERERGKYLIAMRENLEHLQKRIGSLEELKATNELDTKFFKEEHIKSVTDVMGRLSTFQQNLDELNQLISKSASKDSVNDLSGRLTSVEEQLQKEKEGKELLRQGFGKAVDGLRAQLSNEVEKMCLVQSSSLEKANHEVGLLKTNLTDISKRLVDAEREHADQRSQLESQSRKAVEEMRNMIDNKAEIQEVNSKTELLESQKFNSETIQIIASDLAANTLLLTQLSNKVPAIEQTISKENRRFETTTTQLENDIKGLEGMVSREMGNALKVSESTQEENKVVTTRIHDIETDAKEHIGQLSMNLQELRKFVDDSLSVIETQNKTVSSKVEEAHSKYITITECLNHQTKVNSLKEEEGTEMKNFTLNIKSIQTDISRLTEDINTQTKLTKANNENVLLKVKAIGEGSVNKYDVKQLTERIEAIEKDSNALKVVIKNDSIISTQQNTKMSEQIKALQNECSKVADLEREWLEYTNVKQANETDQTKNNETDVEALQSLTKAHEESIQKCFNETTRLWDRDEENRQTIEALQVQSKDSIFAKDDDQLGAIEELKEETRKNLTKQELAMKELGSVVARHDERQNESAVRLTQMSMLVSNVNEKLSQQQIETEQHKLEVEARLSEALEDLSKTDIIAQSDSIQNSKRIEMIEAALGEGRTDVPKSSADKIETLEKAFNEITSRLELVEVKGQHVYVAQEHSKEHLQSHESLQGSASTSSNKDFTMAVESLDQEVNELKEAVTKTEQNMTKIMEQTSVILLKDAGLEDRLGKVEKQESLVVARHSELEAADLFLQETNRQLMEKVVQLEARLRHVEEKQKQEEPNVDEDTLTRIREELVELRHKVHEIEARQLLGGDKVKHITSVEISPQLVARVEALEEKEEEARVRVDGLLRANEDIANTFISIKDNFKQTQSLTQQIQSMGLRGAAPASRITTSDNNSDTMKNILEMDMKIEAQGHQLSVVDKSISTLADHSAKMVDDIARHEVEVRQIRKDMKTDENLIIMRFNTHKESVEKTMETMGNKVAFIEATQREEVQQLEGLERRASEYEDIYSRLEVRQGRLEEPAAEETKPMRGCTVVLRSEGEVKESQGDVLGVYRVVDTYCDKPVYKQDGGENYIYYSSASASWLVGTVVGHQHAWLRNNTDRAPDTRWVPDLTSGWESRPLLRSQGCLPAIWRSQDGQFTIEALPDMDRVARLAEDIHASV